MVNTAQTETPEDHFGGLETILPEMEGSGFEVSTDSLSKFTNDVDTLYHMVKDELDSKHYHINSESSKKSSSYDSKEVTLVYTIDNINSKKDNLSDDISLSKMLSEYEVIRENKDGEAQNNNTDGKMTKYVSDSLRNISLKNNHVILSKDANGIRYNIVIQGNCKPETDHNMNEGLDIMHRFEDEIARDDKYMPYGSTHKKTLPSMKIEYNR